MDCVSQVGWAEPVASGLAWQGKPGDSYSLQVSAMAGQQLEQCPRSGVVGIAEKYPPENLLQRISRRRMLYQTG